jgi:Sigma-70, region 4.
MSVAHVAEFFVAEPTPPSTILRTEEETILLALKLVLKGMSLRGIAEVLEVSAATVSRWLSRAAEHSEEVNKKLLKDLNVSKVELDELWTTVKKKGAAGTKRR